MKSLSLLLSYLSVWFQPMNLSLPVQLSLMFLHLELSVCTVSMNESDCELSALVFLTGKSTSPDSVDAPGYEHPL